ncbi:DUF397 domain-containing protein [Streptomyces sp. NPDC093568]|uniref:DUF397 domain-containing protein n=1 Tax=Streptomyces sp. NPDC093568 TaxID=3366041 RepID=UPI0037F4C4ED
MKIRPSTDRDADLVWHKSSYSTNEGPECVEVAAAPDTIHVRDSKNQRGPQLSFGEAEWSTFISYAADRD